MLPSKNENTFPALLEFCLKQYNGREVFRWTEGKEDRSVGFDRFIRQVRALSFALAGQCPPGAHIALLGGNSYEWLLCWFAAVCAGCVAVPLDSTLPAETLLPLLRKCDAQLLLFAPGFEAIAEQSGLPSRLMGDFAARAGEPEDSAGWPTQAQPDKLATIVFTSGTSGQLKGVMLSQWNILSVSYAIVGAFQHLNGKNNLLVLPFHHIYGFLSVCIGLADNCPLFLCDSARHIARDMKKTHPVIVLAVPLMIEKIDEAMWQNARQQGRERQLRLLFALSRCLPSRKLRRKLFAPVIAATGGSLSTIAASGAALSPAIIRRFRSMDVNIHMSYGLTEAAASTLLTSLAQYRPGSNGKAMPYSQVRIHAPGAQGVGEIQIKGDNVFIGYYNDKAATSEAFTPDGWFKTGDLGRLDQKGHLFVTGRMKNLIILSNGKNVSPEPLEAKLMALDFVKEALVYALDGEIAAELYLDPEQADAAARLPEALEALNRQLPPFQRITKTILRETEFSKTTSQKILRK
ncbi:MAG: AMP-binding protein [Oscillospiraceae bacterium]|jgi:long-chain acyl-CoA synthetase|nr:AMP-binding protein [Oscillospiraceae bacterium]